MKYLLLSIVLVLAGCAKTTIDTPIRHLPNPPNCMSQEAVPRLAVGQDAREALARHRAALGRANGRLKCSRGWYEKVRATAGK